MLHAGSLLAEMAEETASSSQEDQVVKRRPSKA
ncbi:hypothetical protein LMG26411_01704 [Cupriavidus numazuensis]|uniref:Uncharacterized protein n=1 Tax=Cupriavidus numazuensis TaxID=221992 RepID=A0ABM8TE05_9BURK|nr:hypothetical protein LMG26411_01704 [Cupriavidus numazuensis]